MDDRKERTGGEHRDGGGDRQIKEGALRPVENPESPPPENVEVSQPDAPSPGGDSGDGGSGESGGGEDG